MTVEFRSTPPAVEVLMTELIARAATEINNHRFRQAQEILQELKSYRLRKENLFLLEAVCFLEFGKITDAFESIQEELRAFPRNDAALRLCEDLRSQTQREPPPTSEAIHLLQKIVVAYDQANHAEILTLTSEAIERGVTVPGIYRYRAESFLSRGDYQLAFMALVKEGDSTPQAPKLRAQTAVHLVHESIAAFKAKKFSEAFILGRMLIDARFNFPRLPYFVGCCCRELGMEAQAKEYFAMEADIYPPIRSAPMESDGAKQEAIV